MAATQPAGSGLIQSDPAPTASATAPTAFTPDFQVAQRINLRSGPGTSFDVVEVLTAGTPLQSLPAADDDEDQSADETWRQFRTESGDEGWIREIDVEPFPR